MVELGRTGRAMMRPVVNARVRRVTSYINVPGRLTKGNWRFDPIMGYDCYQSILIKLTRGICGPNGMMSR